MEQGQTRINVAYHVAPGQDCNEACLLAYRSNLATSFLRVVNQIVGPSGQSLRTGIGIRSGYVATVGVFGVPERTGLRARRYAS